jgi:predicted Zn finger-like uncharacterized protein
MKLRCDRCRTRYEIADDKVRAGVLRIRCKTCQAIVTAAGATPRLQAAPTRAAGAPPEVLEEPHELDEEWFLSIEGREEGPIGTAEAQARVAALGVGADIHVWRDDFPTWLRVERVPVLAAHRPPSALAAHLGADLHLAPQPPSAALPIAAPGAPTGAAEDEIPPAATLPPPAPRRPRRRLILVVVLALAAALAVAGAAMLR